MAALKTKSLLQRRISAICLLAGALLLGVGFLAPGADASSVGTASTSTSIVNDDNNLNCDEINPDWTQLKIDSQPTNGDYTFGDVVIHISNVTIGAHSVDFDWSATQNGDPYFFDAMILKVASSGYPVYFYDPAASSGHGTSPKDSISHLNFCNGAPGDNVTTTEGEASTTTVEATTTTKGEETTTTEEATTTTLGEETTTTEEPTTTTSVTPDTQGVTTTTGQDTTTTEEVEGTIVTQPEDTTTTADQQAVATTAGDTTTSATVNAQVVAQPEALPKTGSNSLPLIYLGAGLLFVGFGVLVMSRELFIRS